MPWSPLHTMPRGQEGTWQQHSVWCAFVTVWTFISRSTTIWWFVFGTCAEYVEATRVANHIAGHQCSFQASHIRLYSNSFKLLTTLDRFLGPQMRVSTKGGIQKKAVSLLRMTVFELLGIGHTGHCWTVLYAWSLFDCVSRYLVLRCYFSLFSMPIQCIWFPSVMTCTLVVLKLWSSKSQQWFPTLHGNLPTWWCHNILVVHH